MRSRHCCDLTTVCGPLQVSGRAVCCLLLRGYNRALGLGRGLITAPPEASGSQGDVGEEVAGDRRPGCAVATMRYCSTTTSPRKAEARAASAQIRSAG